MNRRFFLKSAACIIGATVVPLEAIASEQIPVNIGLGSGTFANAPALLAAELGLYEKHGLAATVTIAENASVATSAMLSGSFDVAFVGAGELITTQGRGQDVVALASIYGGSSATVILSNAAVAKLEVSASASAQERIKALDGLTIATPSKVSSFTYALLSAADGAGAKPTITYMSQGTMAAALQTGAIDGFIASAPFWVAPVDGGFGTVWLKGTLGELGAAHTLSSAASAQMLRSHAEKNPEIVNRLRAALDELSTIIVEMPEVVKEALLKIYPSLTPQALDIVYETDAIGWTNNKLTPENIANDIAIIKATNADLPEIDKIDPAKLLFPR